MTDIKNKDTMELLHQKLLETIKEYCNENDTTIMEVCRCINRLKNDIYDGIIKF